MRKLASVLIFVALSLSIGSPAITQTANLEGATGFPLEVTKDGKLIYGGDVVYKCESVGSGIVIPAENSSPETRAELERTNERAIDLCTEAGFSPAGTGDDALPDTGGTFLAAFVAVGVATSLVCIRRIVR